MKAAVLLATFLIVQTMAQPPCMRGEGGPAFGDGKPPCNKHGMGRGFARGKGLLSPRLLAALELDDSQKEALREFRSGIQKEMIDLKGEIAKVEVDLRDEFAKYPLDESNIQKLKKKMTDLKSQLIDKRIDGMVFLHSQLSRDQHEKLIQLKEEQAERRHYRKKGRRGNQGPR
jgi:Spy/CpxP family protein refolding chaperone